MKIFYVKSGLIDFFQQSLEVQSNIKESIDWCKALYARNKYWKENPFFHEDVPMDKYYIAKNNGWEDEMFNIDQEYDGKCSWNEFQLELMLQSDDEILNDILIRELVEFEDDKIYFIGKIDNDLVAFTIDSLDAKISLKQGAEVVEVKKENLIDYIKKQINTEEINEFLINHTEDEIKNEYEVKGYEEEFWAF